MKIAVLTIHSCPISELGTRYNGGMSVYVRELAKELGRRSHTVDIYTGWKDENHRDVMELGEGVRLIHLSAGRGRPSSHEELYSLLPDYFSEMGGHLERENGSYDLVHSHYWLSGVMGEWTRQRWNLPHLLMFHTIGAAKNESRPEEREPGLRLEVEQKLAQSCTRVLATTEAEKWLIAEHSGAPPEKIGVVPCGVDLKQFQPLERSAARRRLGFKQQDSVLLFVGRFAPIKGIDRLVAAMAQLRHREHIRLILVGGDGPQAPESLRLKSRVRELGVEKTVRFAGRVLQERLSEYYAAADALVIPSFYESFGLVALEALACGTPVLATPVGVMEELLQDSTLGRIIPDMSPPRLAESIEKYLSWLETHPSRASDVRSSILHFDWSSMAGAVLEQYQTILEHEGAGEDECLGRQGGEIQ